MLNDTVNFLRETKLNTLTDSELECKIAEFGLNDEILGEQPITLEEYFGKGIKLWQYPIQFAPFIKWLDTIKPKSYLEIGCRWGGCFIVISEIIKRNNENAKLLACDLIDKSELLHEYSNFQKFDYFQNSSASEEFKGIIDDIDMVFIDGDHSYDGCLNDWNLFKDNLNTRYIVFHDISSDACPGVVQVWNDVKTDDRFDHLEFTRQYDKELIPNKANYLGIGVLIRK
jgi:cephalosporin hydroxylase